MNFMGTRAAVTNERVAKDLGLTHSAVSRIRSGDRNTSIKIMQVIAEQLHWSVDDQAYSMSYGNFAVDFERALERHYA